MNYHVVIQLAADKALAPKPYLLRNWAKKTLKKQITAAEVTIRIVGIEEMITLNSTYRHKNGPTNVLSFPFAIAEEIDIDIPILGDIVICAEVVNKEAAEQSKSLAAHWAHMVVHGIFHLLGYDHEIEKDAEIMESLEINIMQELGFANPYAQGENIKNYD